MTRSRLLASSGMIAAVILLTGTAQAGARTYVSLAGRDDSIPKLGMPGISVRVDSRDANDAAFLTGVLARALAQQVHTRRLAPNEAGDYDLEVRLETPRIDGPVVTVPFEAVLKSSRGESLWRVEGRSDVEGAPIDEAILAGIGRNVVSALIHDGWVEQRYDPDNPPPPPPTIRSQ